MAFDPHRLERTEEHSAETQQPDIPWLQGPDSPWGIPVLDVRPVTQKSLSFSTDPQCAANLNSFAGEDGKSFADIQPFSSRHATLDLRYRINRVLADGVLFMPTEMEHKWAIFLYGQKIIFVRSWLRQVLAVAHLHPEKDSVRITDLYGTFTSDEELPSFSIRVLDYLIRSHALDLPYPAPLPEGMEAGPLAAANWCMACFGNRALFASSHRFSDPPPERPLCTDSLLHIAIARGDVQTAAALLESGLPFDLLDRHGLTLLDWAVAHEDTEMIDFLLQRGCHVDMRTAEGATALMNAVQGSDLPKVVVFLDRGADPNAADARGFTALHRAAELGNRPIVQLLKNRGANVKLEAQGHTPGSLAEKQGHFEIANFLGV